MWHIGLAVNVRSVGRLAISIGEIFTRDPFKAGDIAARKLERNSNETRTALATFNEIRIPSKSAWRTSMANQPDRPKSAPTAIDKDIKKLLARVLALVRVWY